MTEVLKEVHDAEMKFFHSDELQEIRFEHPPNSFIVFYIEQTKSKNISALN